MCPGTTSYVNLNKLSQEQKIKDILLELSELNLKEIAIGPTFCLFVKFENFHSFVIILSDDK